VKTNDVIVYIDYVGPATSHTLIIRLLQWSRWSLRAWRSS